MRRLSLPAHVAAGGISQYAISPLVHPGHQVASFADLTPREREVLSLISKGLSNQEIAEWLVIERGTVMNHLHNILKKLNASNRKEAAAVYMINLKSSTARFLPTKER
jgi:DNA-binding NarL/FixJ family response regulator